MSTDQQLARLTGNGANVPAFVRNNNAAEINKEATAGTGGESINRISLKGSRFRLVVGGEQVAVISENHMDVVIVRTNPNVSKAFYKTKYDPNAEDQTPDCYSSNGIVPDPDVQNPVCSNCAQCPMNEWGSKISEATKAKVKACSDVKRIAIVPASNVKAPMYQIAVPAASLKPFGGYIRMLNQPVPPIPYNAVVTRISFDEDSDFPKLNFEPVGYVTEEQYNQIQERYNSEECKRVATIVDGAAQAAPAPQTQQTQQTQQPENKPDPWAAAADAQAKQEAEAAQAKQEQQEEQAGPTSDPQGGAGAADAFAQATAAQAQEQTQAAQTTEQASPQGDDAMAAAGWPTAGATTTSDAKEPPKQAHQEEQLQTAQGSDIDAIFGGGFDD